MPMIKALAAILLIVGVAYGDELLVTRHYAFTHPEDRDQHSGLWKLDLNDGSYRRLRSFPLYTPGGHGITLASFPDRVLVQGPEYFEFELDSMRFLRRYPGVDAFTGGEWAFRGALVAGEDAFRLRVAPGIYGFPRCEGAPGLLFTCGKAIQPPGWESPSFSQTDYRFLYRRPLDPADGVVELVYTAPETNAHDREIALGRDGLRLLTASRTNTEHVERWSRLDGQIETLLHERRVPIGSGEARDPLAIHVGDGFALKTMSYQNLQTDWLRVTEQSLDTFSEYRLELGPNPPVSFARGPEWTPDRYTQVIPAVGSTPGANGTSWRSDLWLFNPSLEPALVAIRRVGGPSAPIEIVLAARASRSLPDVLRTLGGGVEGDGVATDALVIESDYRKAAQLVAVSRTWTRDPESGGTFGQAVPAVPGSVGYSNHLPESSVGSASVSATRSQFFLEKRNPAAFRHNVGVVNDDERPLNVNLRFPGHMRSVTVPPHSVANVSIEGLFPAEMFAEVPPRVAVSADRPAPVWLSMVDNRTGDATFVPYTSFALQPLPDEFLVLPAVARTPGAFGTVWRTDLYGEFPEPFPSEPRQEPVARIVTADGCRETGRLSGLVGPPSLEGFDWSKAWTSVFPDLVAQFGCSSPTRGALYVNGGTWTCGFSRTYTTRATDGGTFGDMLPLYPVAGYPRQHFAGLEVEPGRRINIGMFNASELTATYDVTLWSEEGAVAGSRVVSLRENEHWQAPLADLFGVVPDGLFGLSIVPQAAGRAWAYVSLIDNLTGDPTTFW